MDVREDDGACLAEALEDLAVNETGDVDDDYPIRRGYVNTTENDAAYYTRSARYDARPRWRWRRRPYNLVYDHYYCCMQCPFKRGLRFC